MKKHHHCEPVGIIEIAEMLDIGRDAVAQWWYRTRAGKLPSPMPSPIGKVSGYECWCADEIRDWDAKRRPDRAGVTSD